MLNGRLELWDIRDTEAFCTRLIPAAVSGHDREDLHAWLIETCWELSTTDPQPWRTSFSGWVTPRLRQRVIDWQRKHHGRTRWQFATHTHERQLPTLVPLDHPTVVTTAHGHPPADRSPDLTRILRTPGSDEAWSTHQRRQSMSRRAA